MNTTRKKDMNIFINNNSLSRMSRLDSLEYYVGDSQGESEKNKKIIALYRRFNFIFENIISKIVDNGNGNFQNLYSVAENRLTQKLIRVAEYVESGHEFSSELMNLELTRILAEENQKMIQNALNIENVASSYDFNFSVEIEKKMSIIHALASDQEIDFCKKYLNGEIEKNTKNRKSYSRIIQKIKSHVNTLQ